MSFWKKLLPSAGEFLWPFGVRVRYGCVFSFSSVLRAPLTLFPLHAVGRTGLPLLLSAHPSPLKSYLTKVIIIKSCASGLQQVTCREQDFFLPPTISWIYSLFNNCLPLKPDIFHTWKWVSETGEYQCLLLSCVGLSSCGDGKKSVRSDRCERMVTFPGLFFCCQVLT